MTDTTAPELNSTAAEDDDIVVPDRVWRIDPGRTSGPGRSRRAPTPLQQPRRSSRAREVPRRRRAARVGRSPRADPSHSSWRGVARAVRRRLRRRGSGADPAAASDIRSRSRPAPSASPGSQPPRTAGSVNSSPSSARAGVEGERSRAARQASHPRPGPRRPRAAADAASSSRLVGGDRCPALAAGGAPAGNAISRGPRMRPGPVPRRRENPPVKNASEQPTRRRDHHREHPRRTGPPILVPPTGRLGHQRGAVHGPRRR